MKLSKSDIAHIRQIADRLPECYTAENQKTMQILFGHQLISRGITKIKGEPVEPDRKYTYSDGDGVKVNHFKRLKKLCESGMVKNAQNYIDEVAGMGRDHFKLLLGLNMRKPQI